MGRPNSNALATVDNGNAALKTKEQPKTVQVRFWLKFHVDYGQSIRLIGGHEQMGESQQMLSLHQWQGVQENVLMLATCSQQRHFPGDLDLNEDSIFSRTSQLHGNQLVQIPAQTLC